MKKQGHFGGRLNSLAAVKNLVQQAGASIGYIKVDIATQLQQLKVQNLKEAISKKNKKGKLGYGN